jgi:DNA-directed RNA polymerase II subunit RPB1
MGIVQDSLLGVMLFTLKDCFIELDLVMNILMWIDYDGNLPHPTVLKPKPLWTGKQLFSLILPNVNLAKYSGKGGANENWASAPDKNILISKGKISYSYN